MTEERIFEMEQYGSHLQDVSGDEDCIGRDALALVGIYREMVIEMRQMSLVMEGTNNLLKERQKKLKNEESKTRRIQAKNSELEKLIHKKQEYFRGLENNLPEAIAKRVENLKEIERSYSLKEWDISQLRKQHEEISQSIQKMIELRMEATNREFAEITATTVGQCLSNQVSVVVNDMVRQGHKVHFILVRDVRLIDPCNVKVAACKSIQMDHALVISTPPQELVNRTCDKKEKNGLHVLNEKHSIRNGFFT